MADVYKNYACFFWIVLIIYATRLSLQAQNFLPSIQWTPDNPLFKNLNRQALKVNSDDEIMIWCPKPYTRIIRTDHQLQAHRLFFSLYKVETKKEFDNCDATKGKRMLKCNDPYGKKSDDQEDLQILFMETPVLEVMEAYPPGKTYYFIGTSSGLEEELDQRVGGKCASDHMKIAIYVCRKEENCSVEVLNGGWSLWKYNKSTGKCERNCSNPSPQNGGLPCNGEPEMDCSKVITGRNSGTVLQEKRTTVEDTTTSSTVTTATTSTAATSRIATTKGSIVTDMTRTKGNTQKTTPTTPNDIGSEMDTLDDKEEPEGRRNDDVTLSMKGAVLTFVGLFILGCVIGIAQVLAILHYRGKRSTKQDQQMPINHV